MATTTTRPITLQATGWSHACPRPRQRVRPPVGGAFPYQHEWQGLVATLEDALRLYRHRPGTLVRLDRYLHLRTGGMIGSLSHLLRGAAIEAILSGSEQLTRHSLEAVGLDHAAHRHGAVGTPRQPARA